MRQIRTEFWLVAAAAALTACASHRPENSTATTSASGKAPAADASAPNTAKTTVPKGYRLVVKQGNEYFCRTQAVTGSHTLRTEICVTQDELDADRNHSASIGSNPHAPGT
jgi:hypothetical protein